MLGYGCVEKQKDTKMKHCIHTYGQNKWTDIPGKFVTFLSFNKGGGVYKESGFVVGLLVEKFGKKKLLNLIKQSKNSKNDT